MPIAYLYGKVTPVSPDVLASKVSGNLGLSPTRVQVVGTYGYIEFAAALGADQIAALDQYMSDAWGGTNIASDNTPSTSVFCFGRSPDLGIWKLVVSNAGTSSAESVV